MYPVGVLKSRMPGREALVFTLKREWSAKCAKADRAVVVIDDQSCEIENN